jgi:hypothetical protein
MERHLLQRIGRLEKAIRCLSVHSLAGPQGPQGEPGATGPRGLQGFAGPIGPAGLTWKGTWNVGTSYLKDDAVGFGGASYFCVSAITGGADPATNTTNWALLASQGAQGPEGPMGPTGPAATSTPQNFHQVLVNGNVTSQIAQFVSGVNQLAIQSTLIKAYSTTTNDYAALGRGYVEFRTTTAKTTRIQATAATASRTIDFPDGSGTLALTTDIVAPVVLVKEVTVPLDHFNSTRIVPLVDSPGSDKIIEVIAIVTSYKHVSGGDNGQLFGDVGYLQYSGDPNSLWPQSLPNILLYNGPASWVNLRRTATINEQTPFLLDKPIAFVKNNGTPFLMGGTMKFSITYRIIDLT